MKTSIKYTLLILACIDLSLLIFNGYNIYNYTELAPILKFANGLFILGTICAGLYFLLKKWRKILTKIMLGAFSLYLAQNLYLAAEYYREIQSQKRLSEYFEIKTCWEMENRFAIDLKKDEVKYFHFGLYSITGMKDVIKSNYGIEYFSMGCILRSEMECYNKLVDKYLEENYSKSISDINLEIE